MVSKAEKLADDHWGYVGKLVEFHYKTAFIHGYKHGQEEAKTNNIQERGRGLREIREVNETH